MGAPRDLTRAMLAFGAMLRASGMPVTTSAVMDAVRALEAVDLMDRAEVYLALRTVLMSRIEEQPAFDRCFEAFWRFHAEEGQGLGGPGAGRPPFPEEGGGAGVGVQIAGRRARRVSRRRKPTRRGGVIDLRRSMRANLMKGEIIELRRRARRRRKVRLVLLCDVSGSMDLYSRFLLQFLYALQNVFGRVETFTFATRLTRVSDLLRGPSYKGALRRLTEVRDWYGGTRIGDSIREFNQTWGRLVDRRTIVLLLSDGWDTGEPDVLAQEMLTLKRRAARVIWLNPLLGNPP